MLRMDTNVMNLYRLALIGYLIWIQMLRIDTNVMNLV